MFLLITKRADRRLEHDERRFDAPRHKRNSDCGRREFVLKDGNWLVQAVRFDIGNQVVDSTLA